MGFKILNTNKILTSLLTAAVAFTMQLSTVMASADPGDPGVLASAPNVYAAPRQQGPLCPFIPFSYLEKVRAMRDADGSFAASLVLEQHPENFATKMQAYAEFLPRIRAYDRALDSIRHAEGPYAEYEAALRANGIHDIHRYTYKKQNSIEDIGIMSKIKWLVGKRSPIILDIARKKAYSPYNIKHVESTHSSRKLPLFYNHEQNTLYFYNHYTKSLQKVTPDYLLEAEFKETAQCIELWEGLHYHFTDTQLELMGFTYAELMELGVEIGPPFPMSSMSFLVPNSNEELYRTEVFYDIGTFQHILFALGLDNNNNELTAESDEYAAYQEHKAAMDADPKNPWAGIAKEDLFEYHLAEIFKADTALKAMAKIAVNTN